jgi:hypothetical protein
MISLELDIYFNAIYFLLLVRGATDNSRACTVNFFTVVINTR